jgi:hypothetical protein
MTPLPAAPSTPPTGHYWREFIDTNQRLVRELIDENVRERDAREKHLAIIWDVNKKVDESAGAMAEMKGVLMTANARLTLLEGRAEKLEGRANGLAETTGQFRVDDLRAQLNERKERGRHWVRWGVAALVALVTGAAGTAIASVLHGCG